MKATKRICITLMLCLNMLLLCPGAYAANFVEIFRDEGVLVYLATSSLEDHGDYVTIWEKWICRGKELKKAESVYGEKIAYEMWLYAFKKSSKEFQTLAMVAYRNDGTVVDSKTRTVSSSEYSPIIPDSIGDVVWEIAMKLANH